MYDVVLKCVEILFFFSDHKMQLDLCILHAMVIISSNIYLPVFNIYLLISHFPRLQLTSVISVVQANHLPFMDSLTHKPYMMRLHERHEDIPAAFNLPEDAAKLKKLVVRSGSYLTRDVRSGFVCWVIMF